MVSPQKRKRELRVWLFHFFSPGPRPFSIKLVAMLKFVRINRFSLFFLNGYVDAAAERHFRSVPVGHGSEFFSFLDFKVFFDALSNFLSESLFSYYSDFGLHFYTPNKKRGGYLMLLGAMVALSTLPSGITVVTVHVVEWQKYLPLFHVMGFPQSGHLAITLTLAPTVTV